MSLLISPAREINIDSQYNGIVNVISILIDIQFSINEPLPWPFPINGHILRCSSRYAKRDIGSFPSVLPT
jgi:hypothetical protein